MKKIDARGKRVLIIPDMHVPFEHKSTYKFLKAIKEQFKPDIVTNLGDEIDGNQISMHDRDPNMMFSPALEFEECIKKMKHYHELFPGMSLVESNHGSLVYRRAKKFGLPYHVLRSYKEILETPTWNWYEDIVLKTNKGDTYLCHGKTSSTGKLALSMGCNAVQGHYHGRFQICYYRTLGKEVFDMYSGCLIDIENLAFSYGKNHLPKPILGASVLLPSGTPKLVKMNTTSKGYWDGQLDL